MRIPVLQSVVSVALTLSSGTLAAVATPVPVAADCASQPAPPDQVGVAFKGRVVRVDEVRDRLYAVTVDVERTLAGPTRRTQTFETGDHADCHMIDGSAIREGDELVFIGTSWWQPRTLAYPFAWRAGNGGRWDLSVIARDNRRRLPAELRTVDTYPEILAFIGAGLPPTDAESSPLPSPALALSARGEAENDLFRLTIEAPGTTFKAGEPIPITTTLSSIGTAPSMTVTTSGDQLVGYAINQLDGPFVAETIRRLSCEPAVFASGEVRTVTFTQGDDGGHDSSLWSPWLDDLLTDPAAGTYTIEAVAEYDPAGCGRGTSLTASVTIEVVDAEPSPGASPVVVVIPASPPPPSGRIEVCQTAQLLGTLVSDARWGVAIVSSTDGRTVKVTWPNGWSGRRDGTGLALLDATGAVLAREGDEVELGGGEDALGHWRVCGDPGLVVQP